ncbi:NADH-quinone oxidoreductase subunit G [Massilia arenosa]|uniref:NADH-quinone oxidoreductase subunit G n=1 Tax=Zemynaea arenosa TaxID=2561931 RepID=A0A4Y9SHN3_9BURK|nr:NADH-quinone oxidoreductase subunit NuoG [Massilia arenosa]TFW21234.1 NADH-quinone oxidoreductase subunit G [Massilia arenosa]
MVEIEIDGKKVEVAPGSMVMDAANKLGTYIPHFCYHKKLSIAANCRMCLVEVEKAPKPLPACATPVSAGMIVKTASDRAVQAQRSVMEFLLINHPLDCPICDQAGECQLQDLAVGYGNGQSRYEEEKRVVAPKDAGPLISMEEMTRCIQCTRCVRFGQEVAGVMEFGMLGRGEHSEITTFVGKTVDSEVSGNMIDLCPVGALTSKPFRYTARAWELGRRKSVSPHDSLGSNLIVQVKGGHVMRVLPLENEDINECWISDKDRFSYEALSTDQRLTHPMIKQGGAWQQTDWQTALEYVAHGLRNIRHEHGADSIAIAATGHSTTEELYLLKKIASGVGSENIDFRLRQTDFALDGTVVPSLGMNIAEVPGLKRLLVIGSNLRKDHPLLSTRVRAAVKAGCKLTTIGSTADNLLMSTAARIVAAPSDWLAALSEVVAGVAAAKGVAAPAGFESVQASDKAKALAAALNGEGGAVWLGNAVTHHPQFAQIAAAAQWIAEQTGAKFGYTVEAANTVGGYIVGATSNKGNLFAQRAGEQKKAYVLFNAEPELDAANPQQARAALDAAEMVVVLSAFAHGADYADVMLPIAPFSETSGTFINCEGRVQSFNGTCKPLGDARPGWKVLRVLGNLLTLDGFNYETSEQIRDEALGAGTASVQSKLNNIGRTAPQAASYANAGSLQRYAEVPIYFADAIARRSEPLLRTADGQPPVAAMAPALAEHLGVRAGDDVKVTQGTGFAILPAAIDAALPANVVRVPAAHPNVSTLGDMFGEVQVEKAGESK